MKSYLLPLSLLVMLASCTTAYKTGQTPDDVYFSPARPVDEYVKTEKQDDRQYRNDDDEDRQAREERYIRMRVRNRRWSTLDDGNYYSYHPAYSPILVNSPWNAHSYWNYLYNPYCCCNTAVVIPGRLAYSKPRMVNLNVFNTPVNTNSNVKGSYRNTNSSSRSDYDNYRGSGRSAGGFLRDVFTGGSSNSGSGSKPSGSSSSGSSSGGSSSPSRAPVRRG